MNNIAVIGLGGLGIRHFQAILNCKEKINLYALDVSKNSLDKAQQMAQSCDNKNILSISYLNRLEELPKNLDVVIVSTNADVRADIIRVILKNHTIKYLVLEKVLFQKIESYYEITSLIKEKNILTWVNCPRRMNNGYQTIKDFFEGDLLGSFVLRGGNWGLASSTIHFLDLITFLNSGTGDINCSGELIDKGNIDSKRKNFVELTGSVTGITDEGTHFLITSDRDDKESILIHISTKDKTAIINETKQTALLTAVGQADKHIQVPILFQSQLSNLFIDSLLATGKCLLTPYEESLNIHLPVIRMFLEHQIKNEYGGREKCLIT